MREMRFEFDRVPRAVKEGRSLTLTYRSKPLARIVPLKEQESVREDDPIFRLDELAEPIGPLTNSEIDALIYGQGGLSTLPFQGRQNAPQPTDRFPRRSTAFPLRTRRGARPAKGQNRPAIAARHAGKL